MTGGDGFRLARRWLVESGIRGRAPADGMPAGGLFRAYDAVAERYEAFYPEITGYAVQFHLLAAAAGGGDEDLALAVESGDWLLAAQAPAGTPEDGAFPYAVVEGAPQGGWFSFDTAIIGQALLALGEATGKTRFLDAAERAGRWLLSMQREDGAFVAFRGAARPVSWAEDGNCLHAKHAIFLLDLWRRLGEEAFRRAAERVLDWVRRLQRPDGAIHTSEGRRLMILHTHCYAAEGLLAGALRLENAAFMDAAMRAAAFLAAIQRPDGGMPRYGGDDCGTYLREMGARFPRLRERLVPRDVGATAQALRLLIWVGQATGRRYARAVERGLAWLRDNQILVEDPRCRGGFPAGLDRLLGWTRAEMRLYPWVAIFAADAFRLAEGTDSTPRIF